MQARQLTDSFYASPQLDADDIADAAARGIGTIVNNRPDGEEADQPPSAELAEVARQNGIDYHHIPVSADAIDEDDIAAMEQAVADRSAPVLGFCRTGNRAAMLWALQAAGSEDVDDLLASARQAGYDLDALRPRLLERQSGRHD